MNILPVLDSASQMTPTTSCCKQPSLFKFTSCICMYLSIKCVDLSNKVVNKVMPYKNRQPPNYKMYTIKGLIRLKELSIQVTMHGNLLKRIKQCFYHWRWAFIICYLKYAQCRQIQDLTLKTVVKMLTNRKELLLGIIIV